VVVGALSMYAHFFGVWVIAAHFLAAMFFRSGSAPRRDIILSHVFIAFLVSPLLVPILAPGSHSMHIGWLAKPSLKTLAGVFVPLTGNGGPVLVFVYLVVYGYALLYAAIQRRRSDARFIPWGYAFLVTWLLLPVLGSFIFSILWKPIFYSRYLIISLPPLVLIAAAGMQSLQPVWLKTTALVFFLALSSRGLVDLLTEAGRIEPENWRVATAYVLDNSKTGDGVIFKEGYARKPFEYYLQAIRPQAKVPKPVSPAAPWGEFNQANWANTPSSPEERDYPRLWLVLLYQPPVTGDSRWLPENFKREYCLMQKRSFAAIQIILYQMCP
jgi:mannosyltransferase